MAKFTLILAKIQLKTTKICKFQAKVALKTSVISLKHHFHAAIFVAFVFAQTLRDGLLLAKGLQGDFARLSQKLARHRRTSLQAKQSVVKLAADFIGMSAHLGGADCRCADICFEFFYVKAVFHALH